MIMQESYFVLPIVAASGNKNFVHDEKNQVPLDIPSSTDTTLEVVSIVRC